MSEEEISNTMNQDLNLRSDPELVLEPATNNSVVDLTDLFNRRSDIESADEITFIRCHQRPRRHRRPANGAIAVGERVSEDSNVKEEESVTYESFFDCCICLELSKEPVVTNCGHLYCWSCLYQWLEVSDAKECPVCKGEISVETLTPIYGHGGNKRVSDTKIPSRPQAKRTESLRNSLDRSMERDRLVRRVRYLQAQLEREYDRVRYLTLQRESGVRTEQNQPSAALVTPVDNIDMFSDIVTEQEVESRALSIRRETQAERRLSMLASSTALINTERVANVMFERNREQNNYTLVEAREWFSRLGVVRYSEIESRLTVSTSSSVRRHENGSRESRSGRRRLA